MVAVVVEVIVIKCRLVVPLIKLPVTKPCHMMCWVLVLLSWGGLSPPDTISAPYMSMHLLKAQGLLTVDRPPPVKCFIKDDSCTLIRT